MNGLDMTAFAAASIAGVCVGVRGCMLKPSFRRWFDAPDAVALALLALAATLGAGAVAILTGSHASARETLVYGVLATAGAIMLWNLNRQRSG